MQRYIIINIYQTGVRQICVKFIFSEDAALSPRSREEEIVRGEEAVRVSTCAVVQH